MAIPVSIKRVVKYFANSGAGTSGDPYVPLVGANLYGKKSADGDTALAVGTPADGMTLADMLRVTNAPLLYNGTTLDLQRNNGDIPVLLSAARTAQTDSAEFTNYNWRGCVVYLRITSASGTGGLKVRVLTRDPAGGAQLFLNSPPTPVTTTGTTGYIFYPGATTGGGITQFNSLPLGRLFMVRVEVGDSSSYTYSVGVSMIL